MQEREVGFGGAVCTVVPFLQNMATICPNMKNTGTREDHMQRKSPKFTLFGMVISPKMVEPYGQSN